MTPREEIQRRRKFLENAQASWTEAYAEQCKSIMGHLDDLKSNCPHPPEAIVTRYEISHFVKFCGDCLKRL